MKSKINLTHLMLIGLILTCSDVEVMRNLHSDIFINDSIFEVAYLSEYSDNQHLDEVDIWNVSYTLIFSIESSQTEFKKVNWFSSVAYGSHRYLMSINGHIYWKEELNQPEILFLKSDKQKSETWDAVWIIEDEMPTTYKYEVVDQLDFFEIYSIEYKQVTVLQEKIKYGDSDEDNFIYWISKDKGLIKSVIPAYYNGFFLPTVYEKMSMTRTST